jgi:predicted ATPase
MLPDVGDDRMMRTPVPWVNRVRVINFRSIAACDLVLGPLTVLIGPNAAGKSNFVDTLAFVAEAVETTPYKAIDVRGGLFEILRRGPEPADSFSIALDVTVPWGPEPEQWARGEYSFEIAPSRRRGQLPFEVVREACTLRWEDKTESFRVERGAVDDSVMPRVREIEPDRLYLPSASARPNLAPLFAGLRGMRFYHLDPTELRRPRPQTEGAALGSRGEHLADVLGALGSDHPEIKARFDAYLTAVAPGIEGVDRSFAGGSYVTVQMRQRSNGQEVVFGPGAMSDGTLHATGVLAALFQPWVLDGRTSLVGIEEPEAALHPAAAGVLFDALTEASERVQVLVTSQSADLLDRDDLDPSIIRAVASEAGVTIIGDIDTVSLRALRERRFTAGELLRAGQLIPEMPAGTGSAPMGR